MFDSVNLIVKEPTGAFRRENEWTVRGLVDWTLLWAVTNGFLTLCRACVWRSLERRQPPGEPAG